MSLSHMSPQDQQQYFKNLLFAKMHHYKSEKDTSVRESKLWF